MNRTELHRLAEDRVADAAALLAAGRWSGAYYRAGYAVECGLKACIAKVVRAETFPDKDFALRVYTHNIGTLVKVADLVEQRKMVYDIRPTFEDRWVTLKDWSEQARYRQYTEAEARELYAAVTDPMEGVLPWLTAFW